MTFQAIAQASVQSWVTAFLSIGFMIPIAIVSLAGGYILAHFVLSAFGKTTLGIHVRHWCALHRPRIFFPEDTADERLIVETIRKAVKGGKLNLKDL